MRRAVCWILVLAALGCSRYEPNLSEEDLKIAKTIEKLPTFIEFVKDSNSFELYEGLPHPMFEKIALAEELKLAEHFEFADNAFYKSPLHVTSTDEHKLKTIYTAGNFEPYAGVGACGGFHADHMAVWTNGTDKLYVLFCFGCGEIKSYYKSEDMWFRMGDSQLELKSVLSQYRVYRPDTDWQSPLQR